MSISLEKGNKIDSEGVRSVTYRDLVVIFRDFAFILIEIKSPGRFERDIRSFMWFSFLCFNVL